MNLLFQKFHTSIVQADLSHFITHLPDASYVNHLKDKSKTSKSPRVFFPLFIEMIEEINIQNLNRILKWLSHVRPIDHQIFKIISVFFINFIYNHWICCLPINVPYASKIFRIALPTKLSDKFRYRQIQFQGSV